MRDAPSGEHGSPTSGQVTVTVASMPTVAVPSLAVWWNWWEEVVAVKVLLHAPGRQMRDPSTRAGSLLHSRSWPTA